MNQVSIEGLLEKNPGAREVFEENAKKLGSHRDINRKRSSYGLGLPYGGKNCVEMTRPIKNHQP